MKKVITMLLSILVLSSCVSSNGYYQITGYDTVGIIKDYDKNDKVDILAEKMLKKQLPNMKGEAAFVDVEILGEENGKTYVLASYACYEK